MQLKNFFKDIFNWVLKNTWNLFGPLGIVITFYFSLFYAPAYVEEILYGKNRIMHESLMADIEEYIFYKKDINSKDIQDFIKGKELKYGIKYNFSVKELLLQIQNEFVTNKFIPLDKREEIVQYISTIKVEEIKEIDVTLFQRLKKYIPVSFSILGVIITIIGVFSFYYKYKKDNENVIDIESINEDITSVDTEIHPYAEYEDMVEVALKELNIKYKREVSIGEDLQKRADFLIYANNNEEYVIECKKYRKLMGVGSIHQIIGLIKIAKTKGILIISTGLTSRATEVISNYNKLNPNNNIFVISGDDLSTIKNGLGNLFKNNSNKKFHLM